MYMTPMLVSSLSRRRNGCVRGVVATPGVHPKPGCERPRAMRHFAGTSITAGIVIIDQGKPNGRKSGTGF
jgi:hypothetical protein